LVSVPETPQAVAEQAPQPDQVQEGVQVGAGAEQLALQVDEDE
jgi:hypothetical protein